VHAGQPFRGRPQGGQQQGLVRDDISAPALMLAIQAIGRMWVTAPRSVTSAADPDEDDDFRRAAVGAAVRALVAPAGP
jgi:hypothetical protein